MRSGGKWALENSAQMTRGLMEIAGSALRVFCARRWLNTLIKGVLRLMRVAEPAFEIAQDDHQPLDLL